MLATPLSPCAEQARRIARTPAAGMNENGHQKALFAWAALASATRPELKWLHSVPNGAHVSKIQAAMLVAEGLRSGVPDIFLDVARGGCHGLRIELKVPEIRNGKGTIEKRKGVVSAEQSRWLDHYNSSGYLALVAYGWLEAKSIIERYLSHA